MIEYEDFRTGFTFTDIRQMLQLEASKKYLRGEYMFITRATVLGRWHEIKQQMYYGIYARERISLNEENLF